MYDTREELEKRMNDWEDLLHKFMSDDVYNRLCDCESKEEDISYLVAVYMVDHNESSEQGLYDALEHLSMNMQDFFYLSDEEREEVKRTAEDLVKRVDLV